MSAHPRVVEDAGVDRMHLEMKEASQVLLLPPANGKM